ncbi:hypothetical protein H2200_003721 [Cladophialophora chaetospira]|uniref:Carbonic anhydrase n=1 Tax=Cladophialophora chaetospira TaxID=386627 RepID=A0AA39CK86_9EURO|nr:hypothetical protein H2200_003721 [Cladophialophora chaetospira]
MTQIRPAIEDLLERNKQYAAAHQPIPNLMTRMKNNPKEYGPHVLVVSCLDSRANPMEFLKLSVRECLIIRNVGGRFSPIAEQVAALDTLFHISRLILVHHTNCGASHVTKQQALESIREKRPEFTDFKAVEEKMPMFEDNQKALVEDLEKVKNCGFLRKDLIEQTVGLWLDVETGLLERIYPNGSTFKM